MIIAQVEADVLLRWLSSFSTKIKLEDIVGTGRLSAKIKVPCDHRPAVCIIAVPVEVSQLAVGCISTQVTYAQAGSGCKKVDKTNPAIKWPEYRIAMTEIPSAGMVVSAA